MYKNPTSHCRRAKELRKTVSMAERRLWNALSALRMETSLRFRRQHPIYPYIADFACVKAKLLIELDGISHNERQVYDAKRTIYLQNKGWTILRFTNEDVYVNLEGVVLTILKETIKIQEAHPQPLPQGREGSTTCFC